MHLFSFVLNKLADRCPNFTSILGNQQRVSGYLQFSAKYLQVSSIYLQIFLTYLQLKLATLTFLQFLVVYLQFYLCYLQFSRLIYNTGQQHGLTQILLKYVLSKKSLKSLIDIKT
jgi:hypothetical protein